jgi:aspartyl-tRNA(Asn)/glutamyl-tRNA(Gln) amidotransferase subunit C
MDRKTVKHVAEVARLSLTDKELDQFSKDLGSVLESFKALGKADTKNVKPAFQPVDVKNVTRPDNVEPCLRQDEALANTKNKEDGFFRGPKVV